MQGINTFFYLIVLIMSVVVHEVAHGFAADSQGDPTARYAGRLTLNPLKHIDMMGSVIVPLLLVIFNAGFLVGWAKPVPYNEANLRDKKCGTVIVAGAGILANFIVAISFGILIRMSGLFGQFQIPFIAIAQIIVFINIVLGFFNLIPIPPLDGSKIFFAIMPHKYLSDATKTKIEYFSIPLLLLFILFIWKFLFPVIIFIFSLFTGLASPL
ncbi:MAG: site-2 protease family protein [bacterium]